MRARFGRNVRAARAAKGLSQEGFADLCGLDRSYVGGIERGERNLSIDNIEKIAGALELGADFLLRSCSRTSRRLMSHMDGEVVAALTKAAVARRQLDAAIRLWLTDEDILAVYTVAAAAYGVLRGLMDSSGKPSSAHFVAIGLFHYAKQVIACQTEDCLPQEFGSTEKDMIKGIANLIASGAISTPEELSYTWDGREESKRWAAYNQPANFLKHADRDPAGVFQEKNIDIEDIFLRACGTYIYLFHDSSPEMTIFGLYSRAVAEESVDGPNADWINKIKDHPSSERKKLCLSILSGMKSDRA